MDVPALPVLGNNGDAFLVVSGQRPCDLRLSGRAEPDSFSNAKIQHLHMRPHLPKKSKTRHDLMIQLAEFLFRQPVDIDLCHPCSASPYFLPHLLPANPSQKTQIDFLPHSCPPAPPPCSQKP